MYRKMIGVFTAVAAALLLVGVAWASGDGGRDDSSSSSIAGSVTSEDSTSVSVSSDVTSTSLDANSSTSTSLDDDSTSSTVDDNSSTSTSIDDKEGTTNTTIDDRDDDEDETRSAAQVNSDPTSHEVEGAGTVIVQIVAGNLVLLDVNANSGWSFEIDKSGGRDIKVEFESGESEAEFEARLRDGQIRIEVETKND